MRGRMEFLLGVDSDYVVTYEDVKPMEELHVYREGVDDITGMECLACLKVLSLEENSVEDLSPLSGMTSLTEFYLRSKQISDIIAVGTMVNLEKFSIARNQVKDISALAGLPWVKTLELRENQIVDIKPLVDNAGLNKDDEVYLNTNLLDCGDPNTLNYINILKGREVNLFTDCD